MISQPLPNFQTQFSPKEEVGSYDKIAVMQKLQDNSLRELTDIEEN